MKESTITSIIAAALAIIAAAALVAVICGHAHHIFTLVACGSLAVILSDEATIAEDTENSKTIEQ